MQRNLQMEGANNGGAEQASSSDDGQFLVALRKMMKKEVEVMVIHTVQHVIKPIVEDLIRKVVKQEIQSAQEKFFTGGNRSFANEAMPKERNLHLKFLDEVLLPVLTGKPIKGKGGTDIRVALVDEMTGQVVECGPESSAKVEILVLEASGDDNEHNWSLEDFNSRIIREGDKKKPHFARRIYIYLKEGVGVLDNAKLGHDSSWMKNCKCQLGARMENLTGTKVREAWTESFIVSDSRGKIYGKHHPPSLSDHVWRLEKIGKNGDPHKRLNKKNICTVRDFLFLHSIDPQRLQKIVGVRCPKVWKATVDHAQTCIIDDKRIYLYYPSSESNMGVAFDVVGGLKGIIHDSYYVPYNNLSEDEKDCTHKLLLSAFENQKDVTPFEGEATLLHQFPHRSSDTGAATNSTIQEGVHHSDLGISGSINGYDPTDPGTSSQGVVSPIRPYGHPNNMCDFGSANMGQTYDSIWDVPYSSPNWLFSVLDPPPYSDASDADRALRVMLCMVRARKRFMALGGIHVQKRQRTK